MNDPRKPPMPVNLNEAVDGWNRGSFTLVQEQALEAGGFIVCKPGNFRATSKGRGLGLTERPGARFSVSLGHDDLSHLLHALDVSIADIQERTAASPDPSASLGHALLEVNQRLRARLAALLNPES